ncbi:MAG: MoaD/ThiS family protein [Dehalococcoidales bacterium]
MKSTISKRKGKSTPKVTIEVMSWLKEDFGHEGWGKLVFQEAISPETSIMDLLHTLAKKYPRFAKKAFADPNQDFLDYCAVILNGSFLSNPASLNTKLKDGDDIKLSPGFYGG